MATRTSRTLVNCTKTSVNEKILPPRRALSSIVNNVPKAIQKNVPDKDAKVRQLKAKPLKPKAVKVPARNCLKPIKQVKLKNVLKVETTENAKPVEAGPIPVEIIEEKAFSTRLLIPDGVNDIDEDGLDNLYLCGSFAADVYDHLRKLEKELSLSPNFLDIQTEITGKTRAILIDWLTQVHLRFHLLLETLYLTVAIIDRFLQSKNVLRSDFQLVGVTAMFIAAKYEEMFCPETDDFLYVTDYAYSKERVLQMECTILETLDFKLGRPLPIHFLRRNSRAAACDGTVHTVAKYLMELSLVRLDFVCIPPSLLGAAALYLAIKVIDNDDWSKQMEYYSGYSETEVYPVAQQLSVLLVKAGSRKLQTVRDKYASSKLMKVSTLPALESATVYKMAEVCL